MQDVCEDFGFEIVKSLPKSLSGRCQDYYKILVECKHKYRDLFEFIFNERSPKTTNEIGESATEICANGLYTADNVDFLVKPVLVEQLKLVCIFANFHYLDAYQRVDVSWVRKIFSKYSFLRENNNLFLKVEEIMISYDEAQALNQHTREIIEDCAHRANALYRINDYGDMALTLNTCLRRESSDYSKVFVLRDKNSRKY